MFCFNFLSWTVFANSWPRWGRKDFSFLVGLLTPYNAKVTLYFCIMQIMYLLPVKKFSMFLVIVYYVIIH